MGKMNRMVLLYTLILSMVSLPTSLPKHLLVETADKGGDDYSEPPRIPPYDYSMGQNNKGQDYGRITGPDWPNPRPEPSPSPWFTPGPPYGGPGGCMDRCLKAGKLHPSQCHAYC